MSDDFVLTDKPVVAPSFHQLGILVLDGSGSMVEMAEGRISKADSVNTAVKELLGRLIISRNKREFSIAAVTFDHGAKQRLPATYVEDEHGNQIDHFADYNPMNDHGGGTDIAAALQEAYQLAEQFLNDPAAAHDVPRSVVIVVMSDGISHTDPVPIADQIKQNPSIQICSAHFAVKGDTSSEATKAKTMLQQIASSPNQYITVYDAESLRKFFIASVSSGTNAQIG